MTDQPITIIRQNRRAMMMRAIPGAIEVYIPSRYQPADKCVVNFIRKNLSAIQACQLPQPAHKTSEQTIMSMVSVYGERMQVQPARVALRDMRRKWGSCSSLGTVTLNTRLCWLDAPLVEYIVCHELAHLRELNHSKAFWAIVAAYMPDYKERIQQLRMAERSFYGLA